MTYCNGTILVIEDDRNNQRVLKHYLEEFKYEVIVTNDGQEGWDLLQKLYKEVDIILLDRMMPNMDGIEFLKKIRHANFLSHIPVIMQTAVAEKKQLQEITDNNLKLFYYLIKPFDKEKLMRVINKAAENYKPT